MSALGSQEPGDWPRWRGAHHDGLSSSAWSAQGKDVWSKPVGLGYSSPSVVGRHVFVHGHDVDRGFDVLRCLEVENGVELWTREWPARRFDRDHEGGTLTTPAVDGERVFVAEREGTIACYEAANGRLLWHKDLAALYGVDPGQYGFAGSPLVIGELVLVNADKTFALRKETGDLAWTSASLHAVYSTPLPFALGETPCVAVFGQRALSLLALEGGAVLREFPWQKHPRVVCGASPVVVGERLFVSSAYEHGCALVDFADGGARAVWASRVMRSKMAGCVLIDGFLYGFDESLLKCVDLEGAERWRERGLGNGALSGGDGKLAILSERGELVIAAASPDGFRELARERLFDEGVCWTPPVIANGSLYCRNSRGTLVRRDHRPGASAAVAAAPARDAATAAGSPAVGSSSPSATALPAADELFERHLARIGGAEALLHCRTMRLTGTFEMLSQGYVPMPFHIEWIAPDRRFLEYRDSPPRRALIRRVCDGALAWKVDAHGDVTLAPPERLRELRETARPDAPARFRELYPQMRTTGVVDFDQRACHRVDAVSAGGARRSFYFDAATGLLAGREGEGESTAIFRDYQDFGGLWMPAFERQFAPDTGIEETFRLARVERDVEIDPALFERPEAVERAAAARPGG